MLQRSHGPVRQAGVHATTAEEDCTNASQFMLLQLPISTVRRESFQMCKSPDTSQRGPSQKIIHTDMFVMLRVYLESVLALETGTRGFVVGTKL